MLLRIKKHEVDLVTRLLKEVNEERLKQGKLALGRPEFFHHVIETGLENKHKVIDKLIE